MKTLKNLVYISFFLINFINAQDKFSFNNGRFFGGLESNSQWYLNDKTRGISHPEQPLRSNTYLLINYEKGRFSSGIQVEAYEQNALLNYNSKFNGTNLGTYYIKYQTKKAEVVAGYFYSQIGSGMIFRAWEDRALGINTAVRGISIKYNPNTWSSIHVFSGNQRSGFDVSKGLLIGFDSDFQIGAFLKLKEWDLTSGLSYLGRKDTLPNGISGNEWTHAFSSRINFTKNSFYATIEANFKTSEPVLNRISNNLYPALNRTGHAFMLNTGFTMFDGVGVDATLRRSENMLFLSERIPDVYSNNTSLNFNDKVINFTPALTKQHHSLLANIYVYQSQVGIDFKDPRILKAGETGGQIDIYYDIPKNTILGGKNGLKVSFNSSAWYNLPGSYRLIPAQYETSFLGVGKKYFSDTNIELRKKLSSAWRTNINYISQYYNKPWIEDGADEVKTTILAWEVVHSFSGSKSIRVEAEHLWARTDFKNWAGCTIEYNINRNWSFYIWDVYNYGNYNAIKQVHYYNIGATYRKNALRVMLNYGRQRGGLVCVGGVCRFVPESTGTSVSLNYSF